MADRYCQGVGGIGLGRLGKVEEGLHHLLDLLLGGLAVADHGLLDLQGRVFEDRQPPRDAGYHGGAPGLTKLQGALDIVGEKDVFHRHGIGGVPVDDLRDPPEDLLKAAGEIRGGFASWRHLLSSQFSRK